MTVTTLGEFAWPDPRSPILLTVLYSTVQMKWYAGCDTKRERALIVVED